VRLLTALKPSGNRHPVFFIIGSQPGPYDGGIDTDKIAVLERFVPLLQSTQQADCPVAAGVAGAANRLFKIVKPAYELRFYKNLNQYNIVDCAAARPVDPNVIGEDIIGIGQVSGVGKAQDGMTVRKSGRTSGLTSGEVSATGVTVRVDLSDKESAWFTDQVVANLVCKPGDSGSLVLDAANHAVGLLFAGSDTHCIFNHIQNVMDLLEIEF